MPGTPRQRSDTTDATDASIGICVLDSDFRIRAANSTGAGFIELFTEFAPGGRLLRLGAVDLRDLLTETSEKRLVYEGPPPRVFEVELSRHSGEEGGCSSLSGTRLWSISGNSERRSRTALRRWVSWPRVSLTTSTTC